MALPGRKDNRGGARPGAGPKKQTLSAHQVSEMLKAAKEYAKKYGKSIDEILLDMIYGAGDEPLVARDKLAAIKLWKEYTIAKLQEGGETDKTVTPELYLPNKRPDLSLVNGGKS